MKPLLIVNPQAAGKRTGQRWSETSTAVALVIGDFDAAFTEYRGHAEELARLAVQNDRELVVAVGGDGTLSDVANGVLSAAPPTGGETPAAVGFIAQGTGGDFRRSLGHGDSLAEFLERLTNGNERRLDVGRLDYHEADGMPSRRYVLNIVSAGMGGLVDEFVVAAPRWVGGRLAYYGATLRALAGVPLAHLRCTFTLDGASAERELDSRMLAVCNGAYFGSGMNVAPGALVDDGRLEVVSVGTSTRFELMAKSPSIYRGAHLSIKAVQHFSCQRIEIVLDDPGVRVERLPLDVDGDPRGRLPMTVEVLPGALRFRG
jgi:diacylglycerol kinase (ATP)